MSTFSPYLHSFANLPTSQDNDIESYFNRYTLLSKPVKRNSYKISLAQMLNYLVDFGIGYNSVCITTLTSEQQFLTGMYVNRHKTESVKRPATVADLKTIVEAVVRSMVNHTVYQGGEPKGMRITNTVYPTYLFTLDKNVTKEKLKELTNVDYEEVKEFEDFACTNGKEYNMPKYENGYIPANEMLICPRHSHEANDSLEDSWQYKWFVKISAEGKLIIWSNHDDKLREMLKGNSDSKLNPINGKVNTLPTTSTGASAKYSCEPSWEFPESVVCHENTAVLPTNTIKGTTNVTIRWPGRRYRLFKQVGA